MTFAVVTAAGSAALTFAALEAPHDGAKDSNARGCSAPANFSRAPHRPFTVSDAEIYRAGCSVARLVGPKKLAHKYRDRSTNRLVAAASSWLSAIGRLCSGPRSRVASEVFAFGRERALSRRRKGATRLCVIVSLRRIALRAFSSW
jgi:hypothetical protein